MPPSLENEEAGQPFLQPPQSRDCVTESNESQYQMRNWPRLKSKISAFKENVAREETPILLCVFTLQFLASFAKHIIEVPFIALLESTICAKYYRHQGNDHLFAAHEVAERLCKVAPVQDKLSIVTGWKFAFDALPGLLTAIYYGSFADHFGRRPVLFLFSIGMLASLVWIVLVCYANEALPVNLVWASSIFIFLGGGQRVFKSMLFTIVADSVNESHRTRYMYLLSSIPHVVTLVAPPFANVFMKISLWLPFEVACGIHVLAMLIIWCMPESLKHQQATAKLLAIAPPEAIPEIINEIETQDSVEDELDENEPFLPHDHSGLHPTSTRSDPYKIIREILHLFTMPTFPFIFLLLFLKPIALISKAFTYQFASESFGWAISQTTWLRVSQAAGSAFVTMLLFPLLSSLLIRRGFPPRSLDLAAIRISLLVAVVGFGLLWQSRASWMLILGLFVCGLSEGLEPALQGLATSLISETYYARMFTTFAVLETVAKLIGGPLMARLFSLGRNEGGHKGSKGWNYFTSSVIFVILEVIAWVVGVAPSAE